MDFFLRTRQAFILASLLFLSLGFAAGVMFAGSIQIPDVEVLSPIDNGAGDENILALPPITHVTGEVLVVEEGKFTLKVRSFGDPSLPVDFFERYVVVDESTQISMITPRVGAQEEMEAFKVEMESWKKRYDAGEDVGAPPTLPQPFETKTAALADIKVGQSVSLTTEEDIRLKKEFAPLTVSIFPPPQAP